jgi:hypothetical protein
MGWRVTRKTPFKKKTTKMRGRRVGVFFNLRKRVCSSITISITYQKTAQVSNSLKKSIFKV